MFIEPTLWVCCQVWYGTRAPFTAAFADTLMFQNAFATNRDVAPFNKCTDSINYEPITSLAECKAMIPLGVPGGTFQLSGIQKEWPPGCFRYKGANGLKIFLGTNPAGTGFSGAVMVCKLRVDTACMSHPAAGCPSAIHGSAIQSSDGLAARHMDGWMDGWMDLLID